MGHGRGHVRYTHALAFAEGRRQREAARRRAVRRHLRRTVRRGLRRRHGVALVGVPAVLVIGGLAMAATAVVFFLVTVLLAVAPFVLGAAALVLVHRARRAVRVRTADRAGSTPDPTAAWAAARERFAALSVEYAAYECDPLAVLRLPALADVAVPSTARFVDAFAAAQALDTETAPPADRVGGYAAAVAAAEQAWRAARGAAERIRLSALAPAERAVVDRAVKLLTTARDSDSEAERLVAYARARSELARLDRIGALHLPRPAQAVLDAAARGALPA